MAMQASETVNYTVNIYTEDGDVNVPVAVVLSSFNAGKYMQVSINVMDEDRIKQDWDGVKAMVMKAVKEAFDTGVANALPVERIQYEPVA